MVTGSVGRCSAGARSGDPRTCNPSTREQFGELGDHEAFELLGMASLMMRKLN